MKQSPALHGNLRLTTVLKVASHCSYCESNESSPHHATPAFTIHYNIIIQSKPRSTNVSLSLAVLLPAFCKNFA